MDSKNTTVSSITFKTAVPAKIIIASIITAFPISIIVLDDQIL